MKRECVIVALLTMGLLVSCQQAQTTVGNDVAAAEVSLTSVETLAKIYTDLPRCGSVRAASVVCSDPALVSRIASLDNTAYGAVKAAKANSGLLSLAVAAIGDLRAAIPALGAK